MHAFMMGVVSWLTGHPLVLGAVALVLGLLLWKQPRQTLKLLIAVAIIVAVGYLVSGIVHFTMKSAVTKEQMIEKPQ